MDLRTARVRIAIAVVVGAALVACTTPDDAADRAAAAAAQATADAEADASASALSAQARAIFGPLPTQVDNPANPITDAKVDLGRRLYYEKRLSKNHDISCNSCHQLDRFGVDGEPTSPGHKGQRGGRNSPTVYNAALHVAQFWDGREPDVEAQAKGPILNPIEMAMPSADDALVVIRSIPGYGPRFKAAFPADADPITYDNVGNAIGAFERRLMTPGAFDRFMGGDLDALTPAQQAGLETFIQTGCITCHSGSAVGGGMFQKLGLVEPYPTKDTGREEVTGNPADRGVFKVPSLRNIAETGPYFHDGSIDRLDEAVRLMARIQLGRELDDAQVASIVSFLAALTGEVDVAYIAEPAMLPGSRTTPAPDPN